MRKFILSTVLLLSSGFLFALPVGNPSDAGALTEGIFFNDCFFGVRVGFYGDYVFNRFLELDEDDHPDIKETDIYTNAGLVALSLWDRVEIFGTLGASEVLIDTTGTSFLIESPNFVKINTKSGFSWSVGGHGTVWQCGCFAVGIAGQYFRATPSIDNVKFPGNSPQYLSDGDKMRLSEWQLSLGGSYCIPVSCCCPTTLSPYAAIKWSHAHIDMNDLLVTGNNTITLFDLKSKKHIGYALGMTLVGDGKVSFTIEGRFADEIALHLNTQLRF